MPETIRLAGYVVHGLLGEGGMARVYAGEEVMSRRPVAIKVLRTELAHSDKVRQRFLTEMGILANLDDPNIVRCLQCIEFEGRPVMVLERLEGGTLRQVLDTRALAWQEMVHYAVQIARALKAAHSRTPSIVHRDLKPENVMILADGRVKVMDFGIAKIVQSTRVTTNHEVGTLQYMSPEHIDAKPLDGRADLFALGLLMWEMLAGRPPFRGSSPRVLLEQICTKPTPHLPDPVRQTLPPHVEALIFRLLEKDPRARPASAGEVIALLEPWTKPAPASPMRSPSPSRSPSPTRSTQPRPPTQPSRSHDTIDIIEGAREASFERRAELQGEAIAKALSGFARATSTRLVRLLVGLLVLPAAAVVFIGVPFVLIGVDFTLLDNDGVDMLSVKSPAKLPLELWLALAAVVVVVFVRSCWAHHRPPGNREVWAPWWLLGLVLNGGWIITTGIELAPKNTLNVEVHAFFLITCFVWLTITMSWVTGRIASRLFRRLERV